MTILNVDNNLPSVEIGSPVLVAEGGSVVVSADSIIASDVDTPLSKLELMLDSQPLFGYVTNKDAGELSYKSSSSDIFLKLFVTFHIYGLMLSVFV